MDVLRRLSPSYGLKELVERQRFDRSRLAQGKPEAAAETADKRVAIRLELSME